MEAKSDHPACPGLSANEQHLWTKAMSEPWSRDGRNVEKREAGLLENTYEKQR